MKPFNKLWDEYLTEAHSFTKAMDGSYSSYLSKYAKETGESKPQETHEDRFFTPGKIYTFQYVTNAVTSPQRPFVNARPVLLSFGAVESAGKVYETGIDLMTVPYKMRIEILWRVTKFFHKAIDENIRLFESGKRGNRASGLTYDTAKQALNGTGWQSAYNTFDKLKSKNIKIVDYSDWPAMVALDTRGVRGLSAKQIHEAYIKKLSSPPDPMKNQS